MTPSKQPGLYDSAYEHEACGVGFVADIQGRRSHRLVRQALTVLKNLRHRGAAGAEPDTGDGAGILIQMPHAFLARECSGLGIELPEPGGYGAGLVFLPTDPAQAMQCRGIFARVVEEEGQRLLGWREVPIDDSGIGPAAKAAKPSFAQILIGRGSSGIDRAAFERVLYVIRKRVEHAVYGSKLLERKRFHVPSLSSQTLIYKGMLFAEQLESFYPDLVDSTVESALGLVHQRFSTNTFPSWPLAHPHRFLAHNGEINTLRGNRGRMRAREALLSSPLLPELEKIRPIVLEGGSDSAILDNVLELLVMSGRSLPHAVMMMMPEAWRDNPAISDELMAFYEYHSCLMEPWDGPACIAFTDGTLIGAALDRNGLRPARYYLTRDGLVVMASEVGVLDIPPEEVIAKGRLRPGRIFLVNTAEGRIIEDAELKRALASERPYREWLQRHLIPLEKLESRLPSQAPQFGTLLQRQLAFGYTLEDLRLILVPMAAQGEEPVGSMGNDAALAVLSNQPRLLYDYFSQLFAQVTNPPLDAIREELVTEVSINIGPERNLLAPEPESCRQIKLKTPILHDRELARIRFTPLAEFQSETLPILFPAAEESPGLERRLEELFQMADAAIASGKAFLILSDRGVDDHQAPIPALLALAGLHHHLVRQGTRTRVGLLVESGEPREIHHVALLLSYGADAVNPYLAFESLGELIRQGVLPGMDPHAAESHLVKALTKGILKVMSKMGISTIQSYRGAQIFEAVGLHRRLIDKYFPYTPTRIEGAGLEVIAQEACLRHHRAFGVASVQEVDLPSGGHYQWRRDGEIHLFNPETVFKLQHSTRTGQYRIFREYSEAIDRQNQRACTLRGLIELKLAEQPVPIAEVEPVEDIVKRFATGAMSLGSISPEVHEALAIAMNRLGARSNTGEGGEDPARYRPDPNGDSRRSAIKQVASARFGVTSEYLVNATDLQIKIAQGSKPGEGGQIPGFKVSAEIARVRHSMPGIELISPPPHHDIYSIEDLAQLIYDLKCSNPLARIHVKLVAEAGVGTVAAGVVKAHADVVLISGHDGGTGASPLSSIKHAGVPWELGLAETQQTLVLNGLRDRVSLQVDGQMKTGRDVVIAALLGAEEFGFATAPLVVMGCVMMRVCHLNTCPVGVATQDPALRKRFGGKPEFVQTFFRFIAQEVREWMAKLGFRSLDDLIGRTDRLEFKTVNHWKAAGLDLVALLGPPPSLGLALRKRIEQPHGLEQSLDFTQLIPSCRPALERQERVVLRCPVRNVHRAVGTLLGFEVTRRYGSEGLPPDTIRIDLKGSAGQSLGAFLPRGITLRLEGDANDYLGKGLSGGCIAVFPSSGSPFVPEANVILGNVALYGATSGEAYLRGIAGERFAVRNSGARAVVEGVGDHGCEYMTGGRVVVLGATGRNFAAGMSGGIAYVFDRDGHFASRCNTEKVTLEEVSGAEEVAELQELLRRHARLTGSERAQRILQNFGLFRPRFVKVLPRHRAQVAPILPKSEDSQPQATFRQVANG